MSRHASTDEPIFPPQKEELHWQQAWRLLSSPRTFVVLSFAIGALLLAASRLPQRPLFGELNRSLSYAVADVSQGLGLFDVLTSWALLLLVLLMLINITGMLIQRLSGSDKDALSSSGRMGVGLAFVGALGLLFALGFARNEGASLRAMVPLSTGEEAAFYQQDGALLLARKAPFELRCDRPDPQDPRRRMPCALTGSTAEPHALTLTPGQVTTFEGMQFRPLSSRPRTYEHDKPLHLVVDDGQGLERATFNYGELLSFKKSADKLVAYVGSDGPLVVHHHTDGTKTLLAPKMQLGGDDPSAPRFSLESPLALEVALTTSPEAPILWVSFAIWALGLLLLTFAFIPRRAR